MAYGVIYTTNWWSDKYGNECKLFISKKNYSGSTSNFGLVDGYSLNHGLRGGRDAEYLPIQGSELNFSIWTQPQTLLNTDLYFDRGFDEWKQAGSGSLPWFYVNGDIHVEVDGGDTSDVIYQNIIIKSGKQYKVVVDYIIDDIGSSHELGVNFFSNTSTYLAGNQFYGFNVDEEAFDGVTTVTFTATGNYTKAGIVMNAGGASATIRSFKLYELGTNFSALMEADYNEYKTSLFRKAQLIKNTTFVDRTSSSAFNNWSSSYDGSGSFTWAYNTTYNSVVATTTGGAYTKVLHQDITMLKGQQYKVRMKFTYVGAWNNLNVRLTTYEEPLFDPPTQVALMFGVSSPSFINPAVVVLSTSSSSTIPSGTYYDIEYTVTPTKYFSAIGFSFAATSQSVYVHSLEVNTDETVFVGWVKPDNITKRFLNDQYFININSIDGLADLKNFEYFVQPDSDSMIKILEDVLNQTGLGLQFSIQSNIYHNTADAYAWYDCKVDKRRWIVDRKGKKSYATAYTVAEDILRAFNSQLRQFNGRWLIQNNSENNTRQVLYKTGTTYYSGIVNRTVDITGYKFIPASDEVSKIQPYKGVAVTLDSVQWGDQFVDNGRFDLNISGWTRHDTSWTTFQRISADDNGYLRCRTTTSVSNSEYSFSGQTYLPIPSVAIGLGDKFSISMDVLIAAQPATFNNRPVLRVYAWRDYTTDVGEVRTFRGIRDYTLNEWNTITAEFQTWSDMRVHSPTPIKVDISVIFTGATNQTFEIYFDNIVLEYDFKKEVNDKTTYSLELDVNNPLLSTFKDEIKLGDGYYTADISVIKLPNGKRSTLWRNADSTITGATLIKLFARERLRQNLTYRDYLRCSVIDQNFSITPNSIVQIFDKKYKVVGYVRNFLLGQIDLELVEFKFGVIGAIQDYYTPSYTAFDY